MAVYFITAREIGRVKIGFSEAPQARLAKMRTDSPVALALERVVDGGFADERALHDAFATARIAGEWFILTPEIEAFMETLPTVAQQPKKPSVAQMIIRATGASSSYASQALSPKWPNHRVTIPMAVAVYRVFGEAIGPIAGAAPHEVDVLEKFCGRMTPAEKAA